MVAFSQENKRTKHFIKRDPIMVLYQIKIHRSQGDFADHIEKIQNIRLQIAFSGLNEQDMGMYSDDIIDAPESDTYSSVTIRNAFFKNDSFISKNLIT